MEKAIEYLMKLPDAIEHTPSELKYRLAHITIEEMREAVRTVHTKRVDSILGKLERNHMDDPEERARIAGFENASAYTSWRNEIQEMLRSM